MNRFIQRSLPVLVLGSVLAAGSAIAMDHRGERGEARLDKLVEHLDLSDSQRSEVQQIMAASRTAAEQDRQRLAELRQDLHEQVSDFDADEARSLSEELGEVSARMSYRMTEDFSRVYQLLDEEQRGEFDALQAKRRDHRGSWRK